MSISSNETCQTTYRSVSNANKETVIVICNRRHAGLTAAFFLRRRLIEGIGRAGRSVVYGVTGRFGALGLCVASHGQPSVLDHGCSKEGM